MGSGSLDDGWVRVDGWLMGWEDMGDGWVFEMMSDPSDVTLNQKLGVPSGCLVGGRGLMDGYGRFNYRVITGGFVFNHLDVFGDIRGGRMFSHRDEEHDRSGEPDWGCPLILWGRPDTAPTLYRLTEWVSR